MEINGKEITPNKVINLLWEHINNGDYEETCTEETFNKLVKSLNRFETAFNISQKQLDRFHEKIMNAEYMFRTNDDWIIKKTPYNQMFKEDI